MKKFLLASLWLWCSCSSNDYFEGTIQYHYTYESDTLNEDSLNQVRDTHSDFFYGEKNYKSIFYGKKTSAYIYIGESGWSYTEENNSGNFQCEDYNLFTDSVLNFSIKDTNEKVLGRDCRIIEIEGKYFSSQFFCSTELQVAPQTHEKHNAYNWKFLMEKTNGGLVLKTIHRFKNFTMIGIASQILEQPISPSIFNLPKEKITQPCD